MGYSWDLDVVDLRALGQEFARDPYAIYGKLSERGPVQRAILADGRPVWLILGYRPAREALTSAALAKDWSAASPEWRKQQIGDENAPGPLFGRHMLVADPPDHLRLRRPAAKAFTPHRIEALRPRIQELTDSLLAALPADGRTDLVDSLAFPLSIGTICEVLGVPFVDQRRFRGYSRDIVCPPSKAGYLAASHGLLNYLEELIPRKRAQPGEDLLSALIQASDSDAEVLSPTELRAAAFVLLVAGHETTVNLMSSSVFALLRHPEQFAQVRADPSLVTGAIEETLRYDGPAEMTTRRFAARPLTIGGAQVPGDRSEVVVVLASANHDPEYFAEPQSFDIHRDTTGHMAFGYGIHYCLGAGLARLEAQTALRSLLSRFSHLVLDAEPGELVWRPGCPIRGLEHLPVRFHTRP